MAGLLDQAVGWLDTVRTAHLSRSVTYQRPGLGDLPGLAATLGSTTYEVSDESGLTVQAVATDFIVAAAALVIGDTRVTPKVGDRVLVESDGTTRVFEVLNLGGAGHYRLCDPEGRMLRIHAKLIDTETPEV